MLPIQLVFVCGVIFRIKGSMLDGCTSPDPNCHPTCIVYDARHCRICRCPSDDRPNTYFNKADLSGGLSSNVAWDHGFDSDWSSKLADNSAWGNTGSGQRDSWNGAGSEPNVWNNDGNEKSGSYPKESQEKMEIRYVYVEKQPIESYPSAPFRMSSPFMRGGSGASSPFSSVSHDTIALPSPNLLHGTKDDYVINTHPDIIHVPLKSPGQPRYCVRCHILSCPSTCERVDDYGCHSCPCAPSRFQTMPVPRDCLDGSRYTEHTKDCLATKLCIASCDQGYRLGGTGSDGCRECTCLKQAPQPIREQESKSCPATISCMLKCEDGYILGDAQNNGCPACKCLAKGFTGSGNGQNRTGAIGESGGGSAWLNSQSKWNNSSNSQLKWDSSSTLMIGTGGNSNNMLSSTNGLGKGDCKPPMCLDGNMSVDQAIKMGTDSAKGRYASGAMSGSLSMMSSMTSGTTSMTSGNKDCFPMCAGGNNGQYMGGSRNGSGSDNTGCSGPFCATMSGMGSGTGGMGGNNGAMSRKVSSPFSAALSPGSSSGLMQAQRDCPTLIHCIVTCNGKPLLGELDQNGCQTCTCS